MSDSHKTLNIFILTIILANQMIICTEIIPSKCTAHQTCMKRYFEKRLKCEISWMLSRFMCKTLQKISFGLWV